MLRSRKFRMLAVSGMLAGGMLSATVAGAFSGSAGAAQSFHVKFTPDIVAASAAGSPAGALTSLKISNLQLNPGYVKTDIPVVVECNPAVLASDAGACNQNQANLGMPGGPWILHVVTKAGVATGKLSPALVSGTVGDGACAAGGPLCYLNVVSINPVTHAVDGQIAIIPFGINPTA
jgi:hypothetical protein